MIGQIRLIAILILLSFFFNIEVKADEIGSSNCDEPIIVQGEVSHYTNNTGKTVTNATNTDMYIEEVYGSDFTAVVKNLSKGSYTVEIYIAEQYYSAVGARLFNIYYGSTLIKENLDIFSEVGVNSEYKFSFPVTYSPVATNNEFSIRFKSTVDKAKFNAIRILDNNEKIVACVMASELTKYFPEGSGNPIIRNIFTADPSAHKQ